MTTIGHATTDTDAANAGQVPAPILSDDPFGLAVLDDPLPFHERLREAGRVVYVPQYDLFVMGRYDDVHAGLTDWQTFQSAAGVGLSNFRKEKPWRPPSLLLEADPPRHDAPRHALEEILDPRKLRHLREQWHADAETLSTRSSRSTKSTAPTTSPTSSLRVFPDAVGLRKDAAKPPPHGDHTFNWFGARPPGRARQEHIGATSAWISSAVRTGASRQGRDRGRHLGGRDRGRHSGDGTVDGALAPDGRGRHHRPPAQRRHP